LVSDVKGITKGESAKEYPSEKEGGNKRMEKFS